MLRRKLSECKAADVWHDMQTYGSLIIKVRVGAYAWCYVAQPAFEKLRDGVALGCDVDTGIVLLLNVTHLSNDVLPGLPIDVLALAFLSLITQVEVLHLDIVDNSCNLF